MNHKWLSFSLGVVISAIISLVSFFYLEHIQNPNSNAKSIFDTLQVMDLRFNDFKYRLSSINDIKEKKVVLVAVDEESVDEVGRWPWSRSQIAEIGENLFSYGAKTIAFDIIFSEPEREDREADKKLASFIEKNQDKIILGTFSDNQIRTKPFQDYCVSEAFLQSGGDNLIKINPSFIVDDSADKFEDLDWRIFFNSIFNHIKKTAEEDYLKKNDVRSIESLSGFQQNYLKSLKQKKPFEYCSQWLTQDDPFYDLNDPKILRLYNMLFSKYRTQTKEDVEKAIASIKYESVDHPIKQYGRWQSNTDEIQKAAQYSGAFTTHLDIDGVIRRYPLFYRAGNRLGSSYIPTLALQQYLTSTGYRADVKIDRDESKKALSSFVIKDPSKDPEQIIQSLPIDQQGSLIIDYYGPRSSLIFVSAKELLSQDPFVKVYQRVEDNSKDLVLRETKMPKSEFFKGKDVVMGVTAMALYDMRNTPVDTNFPGPEIHQTVLNNLYQQKYYRNLENEKIILPITLMLFGIVFSYLLCELGAVSSLGLLAFYLTTTLLVDNTMFKQQKVVLSSLFFFVLLFATFISVLIYKYLSEERKKTEIKRIFSKYVSSSVVDELLKDGKNLELGGRKQNVTIYFSDVRGFTSFSESMDPQTVSQILNEYLTPMTEIIFKNQGTLDKYIGDAIMAFFGAPLKTPDHAKNACLSALESFEQLKVLNQQFKMKGWPEIQIGIGINTGDVSVGNMGSKIVQNYTVMGDSVNLASRLESATKEFGVGILISESTKHALDSRFVSRYVDRIRVVGKTEPVEIFELLYYGAEFHNSEYLMTYELAISYYKEKNFSGALKVFQELHLQKSEDHLVSLYIRRCQQFLLVPPAPTWDGVFELKAK